jgi:hypothetical protein
MLPFVRVCVESCVEPANSRRQGLPPLELSSVLSLSAAAKAADVVRCGRFEHEACGRPADEVARRLGHSGSFGENLYVAEGPFVGAWGQVFHVPLRVPTTLCPASCEVHGGLPKRERADARAYEE